METDQQINNAAGGEAQFMEHRTLEWTTEETHFLVEMYKKNCNNIGPNKMFRSKLHLWNEITIRLNGAFEVQRTPIECIGRYKSMLNKSKDNQHTEMTDKVRDAAEMSSSDDEPVFEELSTIAGVIRSTLLEIHQLKEEAKERRHRERMRLLEQILRGDIANSNINVHIEPEPETEAWKEADRPAPASYIHMSKMDFEPAPAPAADPAAPEMMAEAEVEAEPEPVVSFPPSRPSIQKPLPVIQRQVESRIQITRERLLQIQRKKMEDRERKHKMLKIEQ